MQQASSWQQYHIPCRRLAGWRWELSYGSKSISKIRAQVWPPERVELVARLASLTALGALGLITLALHFAGTADSADLVRWISLPCAIPYQE